MVQPFCDPTDKVCVKHNGVRDTFHPLPSEIRTHNSSSIQ